jgi:hypothetical protein
MVVAMARTTIPTRVEAPTTTVEVVARLILLLPAALERTNFVSKLD